MTFSSGGNVFKENPTVAGVSKPSKGLSLLSVAQQRTVALKTISFKNTVP